MDDLISRQVKFLCGNIFERSPNHILLYGSYDSAIKVMKGVYDTGCLHDDFICSWHDASLIKTPIDFFEPILKLKFGSEYEKLSKRDWFVKSVAEDRNISSFSRFSEMCAMDKYSKIAQRRKMPLIFIDGIEELFFSMDYAHLDSEKVDGVINGSFFEQPLSKGFGDCLRGALHQVNCGVFFGLVRDTSSVAYKATLGNYHYLFYRENFMPIRVWV